MYDNEVDMFCHTGNPHTGSQDGQEQAIGAVFSGGE